MDGGMKTWPPSTFTLKSSIIGFQTGPLDMPPSCLFDKMFLSQSSQVDVSLILSSFVTVIFSWNVDGDF